MAQTQTHIFMQHQVIDETQQVTTFIFYSNYKLVKARVTISSYGSYKEEPRITVTSRTGSILGMYPSVYRDLDSPEQIEFVQKSFDNSVVTHNHYYFKTNGNHLHDFMDWVSPSNVSPLKALSALIENVELQSLSNLQEIFRAGNILLERLTKTKDSFKDSFLSLYGDIGQADQNNFRDDFNAEANLICADIIAHKKDEKKRIASEKREKALVHKLHYREAHKSNPLWGIF